MNELSHAWQALPLNYQVIALIVLCYLLLVFIAIAIKRSEPNAREMRLAAARDRATARLNRHMAKQILSKPSPLAVGRDATHRTWTGRQS